MGARHLAHEQDDRHHHQPGRDNRRGAADRVRERLTHHPPTGRDQHEEERAQKLREQPAPFLAWIVEVFDRLHDLAIEVRQYPGLARLRLRLHHQALLPSVLDERNEALRDDTGNLPPTPCWCVLPAARSPDLGSSAGEHARLLPLSVCFARIAAARRPLAPASSGAPWRQDRHATLPRAGRSSQARL